MFFNEFSVKPIVYNDTLNPVLWDGFNLKSEVREKLIQIANHFSKFLSVPNLKIKDITISGSNASYGYSEFSDIDLHLIIDITNPYMAELYSAKKNQYNFTYNIKIKDIDVELYVQDSKQEHHSVGIYSIMHNKWLSKPTYNVPKITDKEVLSKARNYAGQINKALKSNDLNTCKETLSNIRRLRQAGLEVGGEFSVENLAFKVLRSRGQIDKLRKHIDKLESASLSIGENNES